MYQAKISVPRQDISFTSKSSFTCSAKYDKFSSSI